MTTLDVAGAGGVDRTERDRIRLAEADGGLGTTDRADVVAASGTVRDGEVDALLDAEGVTAADAVETADTPDLDPRMDQIRSGEALARRGQTSETVRGIQEQLIELGHLVPEDGPWHGADGIFGSRTEAAVRSFQEQQGLQTDGIVGPNTIAALDAAAAARSVARPDIPITHEEREEARADIIDAVVAAPTMGPAPEADAAIDLPETTTEDPVVAAETPDMPAAVAADVAAAAPAETLFEALQPAIRPGFEIEPQLLEAVGGEDAFLDGMDAALDASYHPELYEEAMELQARELLTPDPDATAPVNQEDVDLAISNLRAQAGMIVMSPMAFPSYRNHFEDYLPTMSDAERDAILATDPSFGQDIVGALRMAEPMYARTVGAYFGTAEDVERWMDPEIVPNPTPAEATRGRDLF